MMKLGKAFFLLILAALILSVIPGSLTWAQEVSPSQEDGLLATATDVPSFGMQITSTTEISRLDKAEDAGNHWVRYNGLLWSDVQPNNSSEWNWNTNLDNFLEAADDRGMEVILVIRGTPVRAQKYTGYFCGPIQEGYFTEFADFIQAVIDKYSKEPYNVKYYEIWNEPDEFFDSIDKNSVYGCWGDDADPYFGGGYYSKMLSAIYPKFQAAGEDAQLVLGGLLMHCDPRGEDWIDYCPPPPFGQGKLKARFFEGIIKEGGGQNFDVISFHGFNDYQLGMNAYESEMNDVGFRANGGSVEGKLDYLKSVMSANNVSPDDKSFLLTEAGLIDYYNYWIGGQYRIDSMDPTFNRNEYAEIASDPNFDQNLFEEVKEDYVVYLYTRNIALDIMGTTWYHLKVGWKLSGLVDANLVPYPAYEAFHGVTEALNGASFTKEINFGTGIRGFEFSKANGRTLWVLFSLNSATQFVSVEQANVFNQQYDPINNNYTGLISFQRPIYIEFDAENIPHFVSYNFLPLLNH